MGKNRAAADAPDIRVFEMLGRLMEEVTKHYGEEDFAKDREMLEEDAAQGGKGMFLWMARECGTWCLPLDEVMRKGSSANIIYRYYTGSPEVVSVLVEVSGTDDGGAVTGRVYPLDYHRYAEHVEHAAIDARSMLLGSGPYDPEEVSAVIKDAADREAEQIKGGKWAIQKGKGEI